jgi:hypothetical protein
MMTRLVWDTWYKIRGKSVQTSNCKKHQGLQKFKVMVWTFDIEEFETYSKVKHIPFFLWNTIQTRKVLTYGSTKWNISPTVQPKWPSSCKLRDEERDKPQFRSFKSHARILNFKRMATQSFTYPIDIRSNPFLLEDAQENPGTITMSKYPTISKGEGDALMNPCAPPTRPAVSAAAAVSGGEPWASGPRPGNTASFQRQRRGEEWSRRGYQWTGNEEVAEVRGGGAGAAASRRRTAERRSRRAAARQLPGRRRQGICCWAVGMVGALSITRSAGKSSLSVLFARAGHWTTFIPMFQHHKKKLE